MSFSKYKKTEWLNISKTWQKFKPPYKPSKKRIKNYQELLNKYSQGKKVLLLGATPEIRDLLAKLKCQVTVFDLNQDVVKAMTSLRKTKSKEKIVIGDWLTKDINEKYDVIIGDTILNNVKLKDYLPLFKRINKLLKPDGIVIMEIAGNFSKKKKAFDLPLLIKKVIINPQYFKSFENKTYEMFWAWIKFRNKNLVNFTEIEKRINKQIGDQLNDQQKNLLLIGLKWKGSFPNEADIEKKILKSFRIIEKRIEDKHKVYKNFYRMYLLK